MSPRGIIVNVAELSDPAWISRHFEDYQWLGYFGAPSGWLEQKVTRPTLGRYRVCAQGVLAAKRYRADVIVTQEPYTAIYTGAFLQVAQLDIPHMAFAFTYTKLPTGARLRFARAALRKVDRFVCFSDIERQRYADYFHVPIEKIDCLRWSVGEPSFDPSTPPTEEPPYLCAIGGEGRDYGTFVEAMRLLPELRAVIVARPDNLVGLDIPPNVTVHTNIPLEDVWNITSHAKLMVLPITSTDVPCGHGTLIMAMQLRTPSIVTESAAMVDYADDGTTTLSCPPRDPGAMANVIQRLWHDDGLADRLAVNARRFAIDECGEERTVRYFRDYLRSHGLA